MTHEQVRADTDLRRSSATPLGWKIALALLGSWAIFNGIVFALDFQKRYRAESAWFLFAAAILIAAGQATTRSFQTPTRPEYASVRARVAWLLAATAGAVVLYWPILPIGLLSDDFVLLDRARRGLLVDASWDYLRPFPLALWHTISHRDVAEVPLLLHLTNVVAHGANAWLVGIFATRIGLTSREALVAAALFLVFPGAVEPVTWPSGVFDIFLVSFVLAASVIITIVQPGRTQVVWVALLTTMALATKETAVILPILLGITAVLSPHITIQEARGAIAASLCVTVLYLLIRVASGFAVSPAGEQLSGYAAKEILSRPFGFLGLPFHAEVLHSYRWLPIAFAILWPAIFVGSATRWWAISQEPKVVLFLCAWIVTTVAPLATMLFAANDLQGSRYLYAASAAWSFLIVVLFRCFPNRLTPLAVAPMLLVFAFAVRFHQQPWTEAALERDRVLDAYKLLPCTPTAASGLPDHIRGAYVFRNGFLEATSDLSPLVPDDPCIVQWDNGTFHRTGEISR